MVAASNRHDDDDGRREALIEELENRGEFLHVSSENYLTTSCGCDVCRTGKMLTALLSLAYKVAARSLRDRNPELAEAVFDAALSEAEYD